MSNDFGAYVAKEFAAIKEAQIANKAITENKLHELSVTLTKVLDLLDATQSTSTSSKASPPSKSSGTKAKSPSKLDVVKLYTQKVFSEYPDPATRYHVIKTKIEATTPSSSQANVLTVLDSINITKKPFEQPTYNADSVSAILKAWSDVNANSEAMKTAWNALRLEVQPAVPETAPSSEVVIPMPSTSTVSSFTNNTPQSSFDFTVLNLPK